MKGLLKHLDEWTNAHRPWALLGIAAVTVSIVILLNWATGSDLFAQLFWPARNTVADVRFWSALVYGLTLSMGLPVAFMLWHWRDRNVRDEIEEQRKQVENTRKDINLKEFQEVQLRAAGALDEKLPEEAREQLQIAALHQLRGFLRGEYGESFKRPAFELLLAGHAAAINRIGVPDVQAQLSGKSRAQIEGAVAALAKKLTPIDRTRMLIIRDEAEHIFTLDFPLDGRRFDLLNLSSKSIPEKSDLNSSHFFGGNLAWAHLESANLVRANLEGVELHGACLKGAVLRLAHLEGARLIAAHLEGVNLTRAHLEGANLVGAHLEGATLDRAHLESADLRGAVTDAASVFKGARFNSATKFGDLSFGRGWPDFSKAEREEAVAPWIARGMINVDALPPDGDGG